MVCPWVSEADPGFGLFWLASSPLRYLIASSKPYDNKVWIGIATSELELLNQAFVEGFEWKQEASKKFLQFMK